MLRRQLLRPIVQMVVNGQVANPDTLASLLNALHEHRLIDSATFASICHGKLTGSLNTDGLVTEAQWLRMWLERDAVSAWKWCVDHLATLGDATGNQVQAFAGVIADCEWVEMPASDADIELLVSMYRRMAEHMPPPGTLAPGRESELAMHPVITLCGNIPGIFVQTPGATAHRALSTLAADETDINAKIWLNARVEEHAKQEAQRVAQVDPVDLRAISSPFLTEPRSQNQLFHQVIARLEEIRKGVEEGPFSDRDLFWRGMPEKHLQRWLAARFRDTQHRRFGIHREEEVDLNNETDIQLSCQDGNVCVEIKPVDKGRYSANSLTDTLRTQMVDKYLKGYNSAHGILVLFRLDKKTWDIPGGSKGQPFPELLTYLQRRAEVIKSESRGVKELVVFGIDCVPR